VIAVDRPLREAAERGWDYESLAALRPDLIYARGSGFGPEGPDHDLPALDELAAARTGMMPILPQPGRPPVYPGHGQMYTTVMLAFGVSGAHHRARTGEGNQSTCRSSPATCTARASTCRRTWRSAASGCLRRCRGSTWATR
jgi:formyl-CoA transferase